MNKIESGLGKIPSIGNKLLNSIGIAVYSVLNSKNKKLLNKNKKFKNIHKGNRCFILGNGLSLKQQDLTLLKNEYVFTVN